MSRSNLVATVFKHNFKQNINQGTDINEPLRVEEQKLRRKQENNGFKRQK